MSPHASSPSTVADMATESSAVPQAQHYLAEWLVHLGWTQERLAAALNMNKSSIHRYVKNRRGLKVADLGRIANALGLDVRDLLGPPEADDPARLLRRLEPEARVHIEEAIRLLDKRGL